MNKIDEEENINFYKVDIKKKDETNNKIITLMIKIITTSDNVDYHNYAILLKKLYNTNNKNKL